MKAFEGTVEQLCDVPGAARVALWILAIPFEEWPQQHRVRHDQIRPAMVSDRKWQGFAAEVDEVVAEITTVVAARFMCPQARAKNYMLSVVMPCDHIDPHEDELGSDWIARVHVPLATNDRAIFWTIPRPLTGGYRGAHRMAVGQAYAVNTRVWHSVSNGGDTPRIHFMFDVHAPG